MKQYTLIPQEKDNYCVCSTNLSSEASLKELNLKHIKLLFDKYAFAFLGVCSGMSCAIWTEPTFFPGKKVIVSGIAKGWNVSPFMENPSNFHFFFNKYSLEDVLKILEA